MKGILPVFLLLLFPSINLSANSFSYKESDVLFSRTAISSLIGISNDGIYLACEYEKQPSILWFDKEMKLKKSWQRSDGTLRSDGYFPGPMILFGEQIILIYFQKHPDNKEVSVVSLSLKIPSFELNSERNLLFKFKTKDKQKKDDFGYQISPDKSSCLVYKKAEDELNYAVLNTKGIPSKSGSLNPEISGVSLKHESVMLMNDGEIIVISCEYLTKYRVKKNLKSHKFHLYSIKKNSDKVQDIVINVQNKIVSDVKAVSDKDRILITGLFSNRSGTTTRGIMTWVYDVKKNIFTSSIVKELSFNIKTENLSRSRVRKAKKKERKKGYEIPIFHAHEIINRKNGKFYFIAEQRTHASGSAGMETTFGAGGGGATPMGPSMGPSMSGGGGGTVYYNDFVLISSIDSTGKSEWETRINKVQKSDRAKGYLNSIITFYKDEMLYILYNDHPANLNKTTGKFINGISGEKNMIVLASISPDGKMRKESFRQFYEREALFTHLSFKSDLGLSFITGTFVMIPLRQEFLLSNVRLFHLN